MPNAKSFTVCFDKIEDSKELGEHVAALATCWNDLVTANTLLGEVKNGHSQLSRSSMWGSCLYLLRLQMGHLHEGLGLLHHAMQPLKLDEFAASLPPHGVGSWERLQQCIAKGSSESERLKVILSPVRNKTAFHYDRSAFKKGIADLAQRGRVARVEYSPELGKSRFHFADMILDEATCSRFWEISASDQRHQDADAIAEEIEAVARDFIDFVGSLLIFHSQRFRRL